MKLCLLTLSPAKPILLKPLIAGQQVKSHRHAQSPMRTKPRLALTYRRHQAVIAQHHEHHTLHQHTLQLLLRPQLKLSLLNKHTQHEHNSRLLSHFPVHSLQQTFSSTKKYYDTLARISYPGIINKIFSHQRGEGTQQTGGQPAQHIFLWQKAGAPVSNQTLLPSVASHIASRYFSGIRSQGQLPRAAHLQHYSTYQPVNKTSVFTRYLTRRLLPPSAEVGHLSYRAGSFTRLKIAARTQQYASEDVRINKQNRRTFTRQISTSDYQFVQQQRGIHKLRQRLQVLEMHLDKQKQPVLQQAIPQATIEHKHPRQLPPQPLTSTPQPESATRGLQKASPFDVDALSRQVMTRLDKQLRIEHERRGWA